VSVVNWLEGPLIYDGIESSIFFRLVALDMDLTFSPASNRAALSYCFPIPPVPSSGVTPVTPPRPGWRA
jgi:hypothetical protein